MIRLWADVVYRLTHRQSKVMLLSRPAAQPDERGLEHRPPERLARALARAVPHGICVIDAGGVITDVNAAFAEMTGFDRDALVGSAPPLPYWPEEHREACAAALRDGLAGRVTEADLVLRRRDGSRFPASLTMSPLARGRRRQRGHRGRRARDEPGDRRACAAAGGAPRGPARELGVRPALGTVELSRDLTDVVGGRVPRITTLDRVLELLAPPDARALRERLARVGGGDGGTIMESELVQPERNLDWALPLPDPRWVETRMRAIRDPSGALTGGVHGTTQDITARKARGSCGPRERAAVREAQHAGEVGSFEIDCRTRMVTWSPQLYRLFDVQAGTCSGRPRLPARPDPRGGRLGPRPARRRDRRGRPAARARTPVPARRGAAACRDAARAARHGARARRPRNAARRHRPQARRGRGPLRGQLLDAVDAAVVATDLHAIVTHWSRGAEELYGWTRAETVGRPLRPLTLDAAGRRRAAADRARHHSRAGGGGAELARRDGTRFHGQVRTSLLKDALGAPAGVMAVTVDRDLARGSATGRAALRLRDVFGAAPGAWRRRSIV